MKYQDLYAYIEHNIVHRDHNVPHYLLKQFCEKNNLDFPRLQKIVSDFGGHNDIEIVLNVPDSIPDDFDINVDIETPVEFAKKNNLYCKWHEDKWIPCDKADKDAMPDLNTAYEIMFTENPE